MTDNEMLLAISNMLDPIREEIQGVKDDIRGVKADIQEIKDRVKRIELTQENCILPRLQNIESCYTSTYTRYKENVDTYETMKQDISIIKRVVAEHSEKLQRIS